MILGHKKRAYKTNNKGVVSKKSNTSNTPATNLSQNQRIGGYLPEEFDWMFYLKQNSDLAENGITTQIQALAHWAKYGFNEGRMNRKINIVTNTEKIEHSNNIHVNKNSKNKNMIIYKMKKTNKTITDMKNKNTEHLIFIPYTKNTDYTSFLKTISSLKDLYKEVLIRVLIVVENNQKFDNIIQVNNIKFEYIYFNNNSGETFIDFLNQVIKKQNEKIVILQNAECKHLKNIIPETQNMISNNIAISFGLIEGTSPESTNYCIAISKENIKLINPFDRRLDNSIYYAFHLLELSIIFNLKFEIKYLHKSNFITTTNTINEKNSLTKNNDTENEKLYKKVKNVHKRNNFIYPKLLFLYWDGSPLSYLNYLTVESFNEYNPEWKIILFNPTIKKDLISWKTCEQKLRYNKKCFLYKLNYINNVTSINIDLNKIGFYDTACEVHQSDYFRYYILEKYGGLWSDFDIIYTSSIEEKMNFKEDSVIFHCTGYHNLNDKKNSPTFKYYPIGMFLTKKKSKLFNFILNKTFDYYDVNQYQCIGASMWNDLFKEYEDVYKIDKSIKILDNTYYLPWQCNELEEFLVKKDNILPNTTVGIHWFNGGVLSKQYSIDLTNRLYNKFEIKCYLDTHIMRYINKNICLFSESSYPGGGGEEFLYDLAIYFTHKNYNVFWITLHDWGKSQHSCEKIIEKKYYTEIQCPRKINDLSNYNYFMGKLKKFNINFLLHQGAGHKLICDLGNILNIPTITFWCFWEEAINIDWNYGLLNINNHLSKHKKGENFIYIIDNIDHFYFASSFVKDIISKKFKLQISDKDNVYPTLSKSNRFLKDKNISSFNSEYITLLDAHTLKGGVLFSELIKLNPTLSFLAIKTEHEENGPNAIQEAINIVNNDKNKLLLERVNNVREIYNKTKILLCPTQLDETFCRVVYEAFQNEIPVIFSNCGNLGCIDNPNLLMIKDNNVELYNQSVQKLITDKNFYETIVKEQLKYFNSIKQQSNIEIIENKLLEIDCFKNKRIGIFTPWCDQGLGIQSRIYKKQLEELGYEVFIFSTKPYVNTNKNNLIGKSSEWETDNIYRSPNKRLDVSMLEFDLFVQNYKIKSLIIPEIQYPKLFEIAKYLKEQHKIKTYAIPNVECIRDFELTQFNIFEKVLTNNQMTYNILKNKGLSNIQFLGFKYDIPSSINIEPINLNKQIKDTIEILHLSGLNGLFRKRTDKIVNIFEKIYSTTNIKFKLNIVIQGNFDIKKIDILNKPFINVIQDHLSYGEILNLYNNNHLSIQLSKHEGLGLGFFESCFMNTPVITLNAPPHNEIIQNNKNGFLLSCKVEKDKKPENPYTIIGQTQFDEDIILNELKEILSNKNKLNEIIKDTKSYSEKTHKINYFNF